MEEGLPMGSRCWNVYAMCNSVVRNILSDAIRLDHLLFFHFYAESITLVKLPTVSYAEFQIRVRLDYRFALSKQIYVVTRRCLDVVLTFFERYGRQMDVKTTFCAFSCLDHLDNIFLILFSSPGSY